MTSLSFLIATGLVTFCPENELQKANRRAHVEAVADGLDRPLDEVSAEMAELQSMEQDVAYMEEVAEGLETPEENVVRSDAFIRQTIKVNRWGKCCAKTSNWWAQGSPGAEGVTYACRCCRRKLLVPAPEAPTAAIRAMRSELVELKAQAHDLRFRLYPDGE